MNKYILLLLIFCISCAGPQKSLDKKNYSKAYKLALKELKKGKSPSQNEKILSQALSHIIDEQYQAITILTESNDLENWEKAIKINRVTQDKILEASTYLGNRNERTALDLEERELAMMQSIYEVYYQDGKEKLSNALAQNNKYLAQEAYYDLSKAEEYATESNPELTNLIQKSFENGVVNYTIETDALFAMSYRWEIDRQFDDIEDLSNRFLQVSFNNNHKIADCIIEIEFNSPDIFYNEEYDRRSFSEEVITGYNTVKDTSGNSIEEPIYERVQGGVNIISRVKTVKWDVKINVHAASPNCSVSSSYFDTAIESIIEDIQLEGDQRAIPDEFKNVRREDFLSDDDMTDELIEVIYEEVVNRCF